MRLQEILTPVVIFIMAALVYGIYGFNGHLTFDDAVFLYAGQQMAKGIPPYVSMFDQRAPLASMLPGVIVMIASYLHTDDLYAARFVYFAASCLTVVCVYLLGKILYCSRRSGLFAAGAFLGFFAFARYAASGPNAKTPMVLLETVTLLCGLQRRWFLAALCASLSALFWQPMGIFVLAVFFLAIVTPRPERLSAVMRAVTGTIVPVLVVSGYFVYHGAFTDLVGATVVFPMHYLDRSYTLGEWPLLTHFGVPVRYVLEGYPTMYLGIFVGFVMMGYMYLWRAVQSGSLVSVLTRDQFAPFLLPFPFIVAFSLKEFVGEDKLFWFLPYIAVGLAGFLNLAVRHVENEKALFGERAPWAGAFLTVCLIMSLLALPATELYLKRKDASGLPEQKKALAQVEQKLGNDGGLLCISTAEILVLLHKTNPTRYTHVFVGIDGWIDAHTPGGFEGWVLELERFRPDVVAVNYIHGKKVKMLTDWLNTKYSVQRIGRDWDVYTRLQQPRPR